MFNEFMNMPQKYRLHITGMLQLDYISIRILLQICYIVYVVRQLVGEAIRKMKYIPFIFFISKKMAYFPLYIFWIASFLAMTDAVYSSLRGR